MFGHHLFLISIDFTCYFSIFFLVLVLIEATYQTLKTVFDQIKHFKVFQKYSTACHIFNSVFGVWECGLTWCSVFDISLFISMCTRHSLMCSIY